MKLKYLLLLPFFAAMTACNPPAQNDASVIEKTDIQVIDGKYTPEIMLRLGRVSDPQLSPDGTRILYGVTYTDIEQNRSVRQLYTMNTDGSGCRQITHFGSSANNARWWGDGSQIIFLQKGQMHIMPADGSAAPVQISDIEGGINEFKFSPDGQQLLYISEVQYAIRPVDVYPDLPQSSGRDIRDLMYRHWDHFVETIPHTFLTAVQTDKDGRPQISKGFDLVDGTLYELPTLPFGDINELSFSPDGRFIAYSCRKVTGKEYAFSTDTDIYLYDIPTGECRNLTEGMDGYDNTPSFSPDGRYISWISMERAGFEADKQRLFIIELATGEMRDLTAEYGYNASNAVWKKDGSGLWFCSLVNAVQGIFSVDLQGAVTRITPADYWYDFEGVIENGDRLIACYHSMSRPNEIASISVADGSFVTLTHENDETYAKLPQETYEERWITTVDGKKMHTWVVYPPEFDRNKTYPSILICLGGPQGTNSQGWSTRWNYKLMAHEGYIVVLPNRRGTTAFGQEWCDQISKDYMGLNMQDYLVAARELQKEPYVGKMGAAGASYGGFSIYYLSGIHNNTFDAFLAHAGIFNQEHMYMTTEELWFPTWDNGGAPWDDNRIARHHYANSAHKLVKNWNTPIMVTHGEMDYRVPVDQGMAAFNAAQMMGVPSQMLLFPEENHWILRPQNSVHWHRAFNDWFQKWL